MVVVIFNWTFLSHILLCSLTLLGTNRGLVSKEINQLLFQASEWRPPIRGAFASESSAIIRWGGNDLREQRLPFERQNTREEQRRNRPPPKCWKTRLEAKSRNKFAAALQLWQERAASLTGGKLGPSPHASNAARALGSTHTSPHLLHRAGLSQRCCCRKAYVSSKECALRQTGPTWLGLGLKRGVGARPFRPGTAQDNLSATCCADSYTEPSFAGKQDVWFMVF